MIIIVGLGNPGRKYKNTRHNIGFIIVDEFGEKNNFPEFKLSGKSHSLISEDVFNNEEIILAKPQTFMNQSGVAVKKLMSNVKCQLSNVIIVHDDIDLPLGKIKIIKSRGSAGHKGVESIISEMGNKNFIRFRIGIKPPQYHVPVRGTKHSNGLVRRYTEKFVLEKFSKEEEKIIKKVIKKSVEAIEFLIINGLAKTMSKYNT